MQSVRDVVARVYYTHGLVCASHSYTILLAVCSIIVFMCYPLVYYPLPGNVPVEYVTPAKGYLPPPVSLKRRDKSFENTDVTSIPRWYMGPAVGYIQQIIVKATVSPWETSEHDPLDAVLAPVSRVFGLLEHLDKLTHSHGSVERSLVNCCLRVSEPVHGKTREKLLPEYGCLVLSPANLWNGNLRTFLKDKDVLRTIFKRYNQGMDTPPGIREVLFGLPWRQTGVSRYFITNRQRTVSFAVTLVLKEYDESFVNELRTQLEELYPSTPGNVNNTEVEHIVHLHYKSVNIYFEYTHLIVLYFVLLLYIYFSVKKIEMVKSKWGLALSAVVTVISSLAISVSVCSSVGMNTRLNGGEIFPYLVVLIGMENVLVMTKSVVSTPIELDVKHRVATGLSKEGWYITKNLLTELAIVLVGFFTFVPAIQEFCLFAMVGLLTDFFLQMVFFVTVLSVDIRRMELSDLKKCKKEGSTGPNEGSSVETLFNCPFKTHLPSDKPRIQPRFNLSAGVSMVSNKGPTVSPRVQHEARFFQAETFLDLPRRLRLVYFWASTRVVQRFIMVCSVIWILLIVYKTGLVHHITNSTFTLNDTVPALSPEDLEQNIKLQEQTSADRSKMSPLSFLWSAYDDDRGSVKHSDLETWKQLSPSHWTTMFSYYNITIMGKYISVLPSIHLSMVIPGEEAIQLRVPDYTRTWTDKQTKADDIQPSVPNVLDKPEEPPKHENKDKFNDITVTEKENKFVQDRSSGNLHDADVESSSMEPDLYSDAYWRKYYPYIDPEQIQQYYPKSRLEFVITVSLAFLSVICITYFMMMLYRCMCTKKYSKWRASWNKVPKGGSRNKYYKQIKEAVPIILRGHLQEIECLITDGSVIVSSCLGGQLKVWDSLSGECLHTMQRKSATPPMRRKPCEGRNVEDSEADLYAEYHGDDLHSNTEVDTSDLDLELGVEGEMQVRLRQGVDRGSQHRDGERRDQELFPDLKPTIDVNFSRMFGPTRGNQTSLHGINKVTNVLANSIGNSADMAGAVGASDISLNSSTGANSSLNSLNQSLNDSTASQSSKGYDFTKLFGDVYAEHDKYLKEKHLHEEQKRQLEDIARKSRSKSWSEGDVNNSYATLGDSGVELSPSPIWCLACRGNLIIAGCGNGKLEFWDSTSGALKCIYGESSVGITEVNFVGRRVIVARIDGSLDFLELETFQASTAHTPLSPSSLSKKIKGHSRHLSHTRMPSDDLRLWDQAIHCTRIQHTQAHQRPITVLSTEGQRIVSGSQDFTLKVFHLEDYRCLYTLHGHTGGITCLYLDKCPPYAAVSGSADGTIRLWDLLTGHCVHKISSHEATVVGLLCTDVYIISSGLDDRLCVWERKRGHLLYSVEMDTSCGTSMTMLCNNFLVTGGQGSLFLWDVNKGELVRRVNLHYHNHIAFIHHIRSLDTSTIVCDFGNEIKVIHFPLVLEKRE